ncbi:GNAT family N-acetyltransferase, partial [Streptomyces adelaidensis]|uniref:GNAT family N-acetyltransferase n=1 Tax=Streptomyces adelaidensis TaxID=2796465 RepID=UPI00190453F2
MTTELRALRKEDWNVWYNNLVRAFGGPPEAAEEREVWQALTEYDRSIGAWDDGQCVGTAGAFDFRLTVPGGSVVPAAGVTMVSVAATHRRRGVLTSMMRRQLDDIRSWGQSLAVLTASESVIYGRFGYGVASYRLGVEIDTVRARLSVPPGTDDVRLRYADPAEVLDVCEAVYARRVAERPGMLVRRPGWERVELLDTDRLRDGASPLQCVVAERGGGRGDGSEVVGYVRFRVKSDWGPAGAEGVVMVSVLEALDPAAHAALWRFLYGIDLTAKIVAHRLPVDDPSLHLVSDFRRCGARVKEDLHVRLVDVGAALRARTYQAPVDVVFEVEDSFCPWNEGRWRLVGDAEGASCERTADPAELSLSVRELGAAYLGGTTLTSLAASGRVRELRPGAVAEASLGFHSSGLAPWLPHG